MKMKKIVGVFIIVITSLISCDKIIGGGEKHIPIDADVLAHFNYKPGTYWIYRDSLSGQVDSFYVSSNSANIPLDINGVVYDEISFCVSQINISSIPGNDTVTWQFGLNTNYLSLALQIGKTGQPVDRVEFPTFITYPFALGQPLPKEFGAGVRGANVISILPSYSLNARVYTNVAILNIIDSLPQYNLNDQFFINADVGIIKMKLDHANDGLLRNWELLRYNIVR
jgi:hypothetical protein